MSDGIVAPGYEPAALAILSSKKDGKFIILEVRVGIDSAVPDKVLKMPHCDPRDPGAIPHESQPYLKLAPATQFVSVELTYRDGSVSEIRSFRR